MRSLILAALLAVPAFGSYLAQYDGNIQISPDFYCCESYDEWPNIWRFEAGVNTTMVRQDPPLFLSTAGISRFETFMGTPATWYYEWDFTIGASPSVPIIVSWQMPGMATLQTTTITESTVFSGSGSTTVLPRINITTRSEVGGSYRLRATVSEIPLPEPGTYAAGVALAALAVWRRRSGRN